MNLKVGEAAKKLGVSVKTLQRWDNEGVFVALRNPKNQRYYTEDQINEYTKNSDNIDTDIYRFLHCDTLYDLLKSNEGKFDSIWNDNNNDLYKAYESWIIYKKQQTNDVANVLNVSIEDLKKYSHTILDYINDFDGGAYIEVFDMEITMEKCIDYLQDNIHTYISSIYNAIEGKTDLDTEITKLINEVLIDVVVNDFNDYIKELKRKVKDNEINWR